METSYTSDETIRVISLSKRISYKRYGNGYMIRERGAAYSISISDYYHAVIVRASMFYNMDWKKIWESVEKLADKHFLYMPTINALLNHFKLKALPFSISPNENAEDLFLDIPSLKKGILKVRPSIAKLNRSLFESIVEYKDYSSLDQGNKLYPLRYGDYFCTCCWSPLAEVRHTQRLSDRYIEIGQNWGAEHRNHQRFYACSSCKTKITKLKNQKADIKKCTNLLKQLRKAVKEAKHENHNYETAA